MKQITVANTQKQVTVTNTQGLEQYIVNIIEPIMTVVGGFEENDSLFVVLKNSKGELISIFQDRVTNVDPYELNLSGKRVWKHKTNKRLFLELAYGWHSRISLLDETEGRQIVDQFPLEGFDFAAWTPMTKQEYDRVKSKYREVWE